MNSKKAYYGLLGGLIFLVGLALTSVLVGNHLLKQQSAKLVNLKLQNHLLDEQQVALQQASKDVVKYAELKNVAKQIVPQDKDQAKSVREIVKIAQDSGIAISNISFPSSNLGTIVPKASGAGVPAPSAGSVSQVKPVADITGLYQLEITIQSDTGKPISYNALINFLSKLEQNRRTAQVSQINIQPVPTNINLLTFNLSINVFIKP